MSQQESNSPINYRQLEIVAPTHDPTQGDHCYPRQMMPSLYPVVAARRSTLSLTNRNTAAGLEKLFLPFPFHCGPCPRSRPSLFSSNSVDRRPVAGRADNSTARRLPFCPSAFRFQEEAGGMNDSGTSIVLLLKEVDGDLNVLLFAASTQTPMLPEDDGVNAFGSCKTGSRDSRERRT